MVKLLSQPFSEIGPYFGDAAAWPQQHVYISIAVTALLAIAVCRLIVRAHVRTATESMRSGLAAETARREKAEFANNAKAEFLTNMSHDIRTPMNAILGFTELALKSPLSAELREYLDTVHTSAQWLMHIVSDVLEYSRIEAGQLRLDDAPFSLSECLQAAIKIASPEADAKRLAIKYKIDAQIPQIVRGDSVRLQQVIFNLLENAVKFTTTGSILVVVSLESKSADALMVRFSVADTGIGIPPERRNHIFEPYHRDADSPGSNNSGATGLGLAITAKLVQLMGGAIEVTSQIGAGATFQFTVWLEKAERPAKRENPLEAPNLKELKILIAEDNSVNRRLASKLLESAGHRVTEARNGKEAVHWATKESFDLILMDIEMPEVDGFDATRQIRQLGLKVPIVALTAHALTGDREKCLSGGMDGYISKPIEVDAVLAIVNRLGAAGRERLEPVGVV